MLRLLLVVLTRDPRMSRVLQLLGGIAFASQEDVPPLPLCLSRPAGPLAELRYGRAALRAQPLGAGPAMGLRLLAPSTLRAAGSLGPVQPPVPPFSAGGAGNVASAVCSSMAAAVLSATAAPVTGALSPGAVAEARRLALGRAHERVLQQWRDGGAGVLAAGHEFCVWLQLYGQGRGPVDCTPDDVLAYFEDHWLVGHRGRGGGQPAYATLAKAVSLLSSYFVSVGRDRVRDGPGRNPCAAPVVAQYLRGYRRERVRAGEPQSAAVPLSEGLVSELSLWLVVAAADPELALSSRLALLRDRAVFLLLWATCMRAHDCGKLRVTDFRDPLAPQQRAYEWWVLPQPALDRPYPRGVQLYVWELVDKTHQFGRAAPYRLESAGGGALCPVEALAKYYYACRGARAECGPVTGFVFRPLDRSRQRFEERALSTSTLGARLRSHLCAMGLYGGETCHSFRRGRLQHEVAQGAGLSELMALGHMRSPQTVLRYVHETAHLPRVAALRLAAEVAAAEEVAVGGAAGDVVSEWEDSEGSGDEGR